MTTQEDVSQRTTRSRSCVPVQWPIARLFRPHDTNSPATRLVVVVVVPVDGVIIDAGSNGRPSTKSRSNDLPWCRTESRPHHVSAATAHSFSESRFAYAQTRPSSRSLARCTGKGKPRHVKGRSSKTKHHHVERGPSTSKYILITLEY